MCEQNYKCKQSKANSYIKESIPIRKAPKSIIGVSQTMNGSLECAANRNGTTMECSLISKFQTDSSNSFVSATKENAI